MTIGGNNPPPLFAMSLNIEEWFELVSGTLAGGAITTDQQAADLTELLEQGRLNQKAADEQRALEKKPHLDASKAVDAEWKPLLERCTMGMTALKEPLTVWRTAKQRAKDEAARIAREEAEAKQAAAQAALRASDDLEARFAAEAQLEQAAKLTAQANRIDRSATGLRTTYAAHVTDLRELAKHVMHHDAPAFEAFLIEYARKAVASGVRSLPGVDISPERKAA